MLLTSIDKINMWYFT